jgi:hypothetical protein
MGCTRVDRSNKAGNGVYNITLEFHSNISYLPLVYTVLTVIKLCSAPYAYKLLYYFLHTVF